MSQPQGKSRSCLRYGCLGCLGFVAVFVGAVVVFSLIGLLAGTGGGEVESFQEVQTLPEGSADWDRGSEAFPDVGQPLPAGRIGRVVLDLSMARFEIVAGGPGESIRIESRYDPKAFHLVPEMTTGEDGGWVYRLHFSRKGGWLTTIRSDNDNDNRVRLILPRDVPFVLEGKIGVGQSIAELGGLWILETDLELGTGEHTLRFDEPLAQPMRAFRLDGSVGQLTVVRLGNASPSDVFVDHGVGEARLDLRGAWARDAELEMRCGIGECGIDVPDRARLELVSSGVWIGESSQSAVRRANERQPPGVPTLRLRSSAKIGELHFFD